ncbi:hypothetical protein C8J56DRAFT_1023901 [Mycena floridula]|nr:hypothetical protein C8J56DRAFT_1023901 [Mycena floridula]
MAVCITAATATQTNVLTTDSTTFSLSFSLSTVEPITSTLTAQSCSSLASGASGASCVPITTTTTIPGAINTVTNTVPVTVPVIETNFVTLFTTSCGSQESGGGGGGGVSPSDPNNNQITSQSASTTTTTSPTSGPSNTGPVQQTSQQSSSVSSSGSNTTGGSLNPDDHSTSSSAKLGPIIGGVAGGILGLAAIVLVVWFILKRRKRWDDIFEKEDDIQFPSTGRKRFSLSADVEPKPYQYGLVGQPSSTPSHTSPPASPSMNHRPLSADLAYGGMMMADNNRNMNQAPLGAMTAQPGLLPNSSVSTGSRPGMGQQQYSTNIHSRATSSTTLHSNAASISSPPLQPRSSWNNAAPPPQNNDEYFGRPGSPMSFQESRRLQIANQIPGSSDPRASISSEVGEQRDGKGRLKSTGSGQVLVHSDAGQVPEPQASGSGSAIVQPPAYTELS